jgi:hypothetical protein
LGLYIYIIYYKGNNSIFFGTNEHIFNYFFDSTKVQKYQQGILIVQTLHISIITMT